MKKTVFCTMLTLAFIFSFALSIHGEMQSENYRIPTWIAANSGATMVSDSFNLDATVGEPMLPVDAPPSSDSYDLYVGSMYTILIPLSVGIDIKPGGGPNSISLKKNSVIAVAILSSDYFDATSVDPETVLFAGAPHTTKHDFVKDPTLFEDHTEDVNKDGLMDFVLHFNSQETILHEESAEAILTGYTTDEIWFEGKDWVRCK